MAKVIYKNKEGKRIPGTTTIISSNLGWNTQGLMHWAWEQGINGDDYKQARDKAADIGTIGHALIEADLKGGRYTDYVDLRGVTQDMLDKAMNTFKAWEQWKNLFSFELISSEESLVSEKYQYGGTIDIATIQGENSILDIKTSNSIYPDHKIQLAAYGNLWNENYPEDPITAYYILQLGKNDGSFAYYYFPELTEAWEAFKYLRQLHDIKKKIS